MDHLIIGGTGAVGTTWAYLLHQAGDKVSVYVRPKYKQEIEQNGRSLTVHNLRPPLLMNLGALFASMLISWVLIRLLCGPLLFGWVFSSIIGLVLHKLVRPHLPAPPIVKIPIKDILTDLKSINNNKNNNNNNQSSTANNSSSGSSSTGEKHDYDVVWICLASTSLRNTDLIKDIVR